jgi:hypothetical protein
LGGIFRREESGNLEEIRPEFIDLARSRSLSARFKPGKQREKKPKPAEAVGDNFSLTIRCESSEMVKNPDGKSRDHAF